MRIQEFAKRMGEASLTSFIGTLDKGCKFSVAEATVFKTLRDNFFLSYKYEVRSKKLYKFT